MPIEHYALTNPALLENLKGRTFRCDHCLELKAFSTLYFAIPGKGGEVEQLCPICVGTNVQPPKKPKEPEYIERYFLHVYYQAGKVTITEYPSLENVVKKSNGIPASKNPFVIKIYNETRRELKR